MSSAPTFSKTSKSTGARVRAAAVSLGMTPPGDWDAFAHAVRSLVVDAVTARRQLLVFPEYASLGLEYGPGGRDEAFDRRVASDVPELFGTLATQHALWLLGGTHRRRDADGMVRNVATLYGPRGERFEQAKLQRIPSELAPPDPIAAASGFNVIETELGALAILTCYDVEFPEHARALATCGAEILLVPSWTETLAGFWRVRHCAHARAIEDQVFVLHAPLVGSLASFGIDECGVGSAAILAPCDPLVSVNGVLAEGPMGSNGHLACAELDLGLLAEVRTSGAVRTLGDHLVGPRWGVGVVS